MPETTPTHQPKSPWVIWIPVIILALAFSGGSIVLRSYFQHVQAQMSGVDKDRPPLITLLTDLEDLTERSGKQVKLSELKGKVLLMGHVYTTCPMGCATIIDEMKKVFDEYSPTHPSLQLVSFAIDTGDDAKRMTQYAEGNEIKTDRWWFLNGDQPKIRHYLSHVVKFYSVVEKPKEKQTSIVDKYEHDMRVALIDANGYLRGMYDILNPDPDFREMARKKLRKDLQWVLDEKEKPTAKP